MPKDKNHDWNRTPIRNAFLLLALGCLSLTGHAAVNAPSAFDRFMEQATGAGKQTVDFSKNGTPVAVPGVPRIDTDGSANPYAKQTGSVRNPSGNPVPVEVKRKIPSAAVGKAVGKAMAKALPGVGVAIAIKELAEELGWDFTANPDGTMSPKKPQTICQDGTLNCYEYFTVYPGTEAPTGAAYDTITQACSAWVTQLARNEALTVNATSSLCSVRRTSDDYDFSAPMRQRVKQGQSTVTGYAPATNQEFLDEIARQSGWPAGSKISDVLASPEASDGEKIQTIPDTVTGPATTPGKQSVTQNTTNNTTSTTTTNHNHTYEGNTITTTNVTNTVITNTTTGDTITNTTTTESPSPEKDPVDECEANPERVSCLDTDTPELEIPKETKTISYSEENVFGTGACPANLTANVGTLGKSITVWDWQKTCDYSIGLRALVIALATFAAALIIMPGSTRV